METYALLLLAGQAVGIEGTVGTAFPDVPAFVGTAGDRGRPSGAPVT
ncbi:MAG: hypothetical protein H0T57_01390 [Rubrobacter sp.]|nr:hypothetical protein [Rubrobacter sp.]